MPGVHGKFNEIMFCTSRDEGRQQIEDAVSMFQNVRPERQGKPAADRERQALAEAFPCKEEG